MSAYAHICPKCDHESWRHGLLPDQPVTGTYRCHCGCEIVQSDPTIRLSKKQYDEWRESRAADPTP